MEENTETPEAPTSGNKNMLLIGLFVVIVLGVLGGMFIMGQAKKPAAQPTAVPAQVTEASPTAAQGAMVEVTQEVSPTSASAMKDDSTMAKGKTKTFTIEASSFKFSPATMTVGKGDSVTIVLTGKGNTQHDWVIDEFNAHTKRITAGETDTISFVANKVGTYEYYCSVGNHRQMGMVGTLSVQ